MFGPDEISDTVGASHVFFVPSSCLLRAFFVPSSYHLHRQSEWNRVDLRPKTHHVCLSTRTTLYHLYHVRGMYQNLAVC
jgi:hypothetical protein